MAYLIHSTFSSTPEQPRFRAVVPLDPPVRGVDWPDLYPRILAYLFPGAATHDPDASRMYYTPSAPLDGLIFAEAHDGGTLNAYDLPPEPCKNGKTSAPAIGDVIPGGKSDARYIPLVEWR